MDWAYYWEEVKVGFQVTGGFNAVILVLIPYAAGAAAVHLQFRSIQRTRWAPFGVILLAYLGLWIGMLVISALSEFGNDHPAVFTFIAIPLFFLTPLVGALVGIWRGYKCTLVESCKADVSFAIVMAITMLLETLFAPYFISM